MASTTAVDVHNVLQQNHSTKLAQFEQTLRHYYDIRWFEYFRCYPDGSVVILSNATGPLDYFYSEKLYPYTWIHNQPSTHYQTGWITWGLSRSIFSAHQEWINREYNTLFGVDHGFTWINQQHQYCDFLSLYNDNNDTEIYERSWTKLRQVVSHFYQLFAKDLPSIAQNRLNPRFKHWPRALFAAPIICSDDTAATQNHHFTGKYHLTGPYQGTYLTQRETECIQWLLNGKTAEETGMILYISKKTVERHFEAIKAKLNCNNKYQIIKIALEQRIV